MTDRAFDDNLARGASFGRRKVTPRVCVADSKKHLRAFLTDVLEDLGFVTSECAKADELDVILKAQLPDLIVLGLSADGIEAGKILEILVRGGFAGKVLAIADADGVPPSVAADRLAEHRMSEVGRLRGIWLGTMGSA